jgi:hypothetical protein
MRARAVCDATRPRAHRRACGLRRGARRPTRGTRDSSVGFEVSCAARWRDPALTTEATREFGRKSRKNLCVTCCRAAHLDCAENGGMQRARKAAGGRHGQQDSELGKRRCDVAGGPRRTLDRRTRFGRDSSAAAKRTAASVAQCTTGGGKRLEPRCSMDLRDACQARYGRPTSTAHFGLRAGRARSREFVESPKTTESRLAPYPRVLLEIYR